VFQFESSGMRELLRKAKPERLDDLIALNALYRPGPLKSGMVDDFIARKQGKTEVKYELPQLQPILGSTYGVIAYQEQVMRIAAELAGFTLGQTDVLRKAMGKKDPKVMAKQREAFLAGAKAKGINEKKAAKIFELMEYFAGYGFPKAHSTAYAFLAYQTGYLKANYPWHFAAALLTIEAANTDKLAMYLAECRERGIPVLPPDINESQLNFSVEPGRGVRFGLTAIKGLGEAAVNAILEARIALGGRIPSLHALCETLDLRLANKRVFEALVKAGACDPVGRAAIEESPDGASLRQHRARLFAAIDSACEHGSRTQRDKDLGQADLFGAEGNGGPAALAIPLPDVAAWTHTEHLNYEKEALGLYWSGHPIDRFGDDLRELGAKSTGDLGLRREPEPEDVERDGAVADGAAEGADSPDTGGRKADQTRANTVEDISIGGIVASVRPLKTRKGERMCVLVLEDAHGSIEVVVFPETFGRCGALVETGRMVLVEGKLERDDESARIIASSIAPIETVCERLTSCVEIHLCAPPHDRTTFLKLWDVLAQHKGDRPIAIDLADTERHLRVRTYVHPQIRVRPSVRLVTDVEKICGAGTVSLRHS